METSSRIIHSGRYAKDENESAVDCVRGSDLGRRKSMCKGPEIGKKLAQVRT